MSEITPNLVNQTSLGRVHNAAQGASRAPEASESAAAARSRDDRVELSERARLLSKLRETPEIRQNLVNEVRARIEGDDYLTSDKLDQAADNLISDLDTLG